MKKLKVPINDPVLGSILLMLQRCADSQPDKTCDHCRKLSRCRNTWDRASVISSHDLLDNREARKIINNFEAIVCGG